MLPSSEKMSCQASLLAITSQCLSSSGNFVVKSLCYILTRLMRSATADNDDMRIARGREMVRGEWE